MKLEIPVLLTLQVRDLIASDQLNVVSEEIVYKAIVTWIRHDASTRDRYLGKVSNVFKNFEMSKNTSFLLGIVFNWISYQRVLTASSSEIHSSYQRDTFVCAKAAITTGHNVLTGRFKDDVETSKYTNTET